MNIPQKKKSISIIIAINCIILFSNIINISIFNLSSNEGGSDEDLEVKIPDNIKLANNNDPEIEIGSIENREGKIFCDISTSDTDLYVNRYQPGLSIQPELFLQNWNITHARMQFENIYALNYTKNIETEYSEYIVSSEKGPKYIYQMFSVELSQYVNNVSIFILDVFNPANYTDWEIAIVNCSNSGTPNQFETLGKLRKSVPIGMNAKPHWETFDFKNSDGSIYLNKSNTYRTVENEINKYWFAIRVEIPCGNPAQNLKFLYFNPDGDTYSDIGEGETFAQSPEFTFDNYTLNYVKENRTINGTIIKGGIESFKNWTDDNRYIVENESRFVNITTRFELEELKNSRLNWSQLNKTLLWGIKHNDLNWWIRDHYKYVYSIDLNLAINVSNKDGIKNANLTFFNWIDKVWNTSYVISFENLTQTDEMLINYRIKDPITKAIYIVAGINSKENQNNSLKFKFEYESNGTSDFNVSINQFTVEIGELEELTTIQPHDPQIQKLYYCNNVTQSNGTMDFESDGTIEALKFNNDDKRIQNRAETNNISIEFTFDVLTELNNSLWDVDFYDWITVNPYPIIPITEIRVQSNVSISHKNNITLAVLEFFKGNNTSEFLSDEQNDASWIRVSETNRTFAFTEEQTELVYLDAGFTWIFLQFLNRSNNNTIKMRLRYQTNVSDGDPDWAFNVSINHVSINFYIQNAYSSDIASKIGLGLKSATLSPSLIKMQNLGLNITDNGYQRGIWEADISDGSPTEAFFNFNVTSIWPEIIFDVSGIYTIEHSQSYIWEYKLDDSVQKVLWNVSSDISYYDYIDYTTLQNSQGLQIIVPSDWELMEIYDCSVSPPNPNGGWFSTSQSAGHFNTITVYNIYDGSWKISLNSSKSTLLLNVNSTSTYIDKMIKTDIDIKENYGGNIYLKIYNSSSALIFSQITTLNESSLEHSASYYWDIFSTTTSGGTYYLKAFWILYNETHTFLALNITEIVVSKYKVALEILNNQELSKTHIFGDNILIKGKLTNNETGADIDGELVIGKVYDKDQNLIDNSLRDITNNEGIIHIEYHLPSEVRSISIELVYNTSGTYYSAGQNLQTLKINQISQLENDLKEFLKYLPYIVAILVIALATVVGLRYRKIKLRRIWAGEAMILDDLLKISHVMIIHKDVGVSIYDKQFSLEDIDADLISGFLHAISQFRSEIKKGTSPDEGKGFEMDYGDFKIVLSDGNYIRTALILDGIPSEKLKENQLLFTEEFEKTFETLLKEFDGDVTEFRKSDALIEKYFNISLTYPLQLAKHYELIKVKGLDKALVEVADQIQKEKKFFFTSNLLNYALAGRKASRDEIVSIIIDLKRRGVIIPALEE